MKLFLYSFMTFIFFSKFSHAQVMESPEELQIEGVYPEESMEYDLQASHETTEPYPDVSDDYIEESEVYEPAYEY